MELKIFAVFAAGLVSFLSPCVLPLVPGYVSMLSGMGVEQLRQGGRASGKLLSSSLAFVAGFSVVFVAFGASASAVGRFLLHNRSLLAPLAGAIIVLFGLHLVGWLGHIKVRQGVLIGGLLIVAAVAFTLLPPSLTASLGRTFRPIHLVSASLVFLLGPLLTRWSARDLHFRSLGGDPG